MFHFRAGNNLIAVGNLIIYILRNEVTDKFKVKLIEETLSLNSLYDDYQVSMRAYGYKLLLAYLFKIRL